MATFGEIVYMVLDEIKSLGGDSSIQEEHVIFLAKHYRNKKLTKTNVKEILEGKKTLIKGIKNVTVKSPGA